MMMSQKLLCLVKQIEVILSRVLEHVSEWIVDKPVMHHGKTESILFATKLNLISKSSSIKANKSVKYLGAFIDESLS
jgi:hypothetical protein